VELVPSLTEMGLPELEEKPMPKAPEPTGRDDSYTLLNGILFLSFIMPALFAKLIGAPMMFFHQMVFVWVHESGHGVMGLTGSPLLGAAGGTGFELLASLVPAAICLSDRRSTLAGCVLLFCAALTVQHAGIYMQSAQSPRGFGFGGVRMTPETHDWAVIFRETGLVEDTFTFGQEAASLGHAAAVVFLMASVFGAAPTLGGWEPKGPFDMISPGAFAASAYLAYSSAPAGELIVGVAFAAPLAWRLARRRLNPGGQ
jgi:hypothetical protein